LIESLKRAMNAYTKSPFPFAWGSLLYIFLFFVFLFAVIGIGLIYFLIMSVLNQEVSPTSIPSMILAALIAFIFLFILGGLNAALIKTYRAAALKNKMSLTAFFAAVLDRAPAAFAISLLRDLILLIFAGPAIAIYLYSFANMDYVDMVLGAYLLIVGFIIHMLFTPALIYSAIGSDIFGSLKRTFNILRRKHINFLGLYLVFCLAWLLNLIPLIGLFFIFFIYPIAYTAMIIMMEGIISREDDDE
jgi:hypothetical protein